MKKSFLYALAIVFLDVMAAYSIITANIDPREEAYKNAVAAAENYESSRLYYNSIQSYTQALKLKESHDLRIKIADLYEKGYENGEISSIKGKYDMLETVVKKYPEDAESYDMIISYHYSQGNYVKCSEYVRLARENGLESQIINDCYDRIKRMYTVYETVYEDIEDLGSCIAAKRNVITENDRLDENGNVIYTEDNNGERIPQKEKRQLTEYTFMYYGSSRTDVYTAVNMSPPGLAEYSDGKSYEILFRKDFGNDIVSGERSSEIYSRLEADGIRQCYIGESNEYEAGVPFGNGRLPLFNTKTGKYDMFGISGKKLAEGYDYLGCFANDLAYSEKDGIKAIVNADGKPVFSERISDVILGHGQRCSYYGKMFVKFEGDVNYRMINSVDLSDTGFDCEDADLFFGEAAAYCKNGKYGFVNDDGSVFSEPVWDGAKSYSNGYAAVKRDGKWGYINRYGDIVIEPAYDEALYIDPDGKGFVFSEGKWLLITLFYTE